MLIEISFQSINGYKDANLLCSIVYVQHETLTFPRATFTWPSYYCTIYDWFINFSFFPQDHRWRSRHEHYRQPCIRRHISSLLYVCLNSPNVIFFFLLEVQILNISVNSAFDFSFSSPFFFAPHKYYINRQIQRTNITTLAPYTFNGTSIGQQLYVM